MSEPETPQLTPSRATWLLLRRSDTREARDGQVLTAIAGQHSTLAEAMGLAQDFAQLVRSRQPDQLEPWLARAASNLSEAFQRFTKRLWEDYNLVKAGATLPWSNGPVEERINRLKMLKRQRCGRAKLNLLNRHFRLASERVHDQAPGQQTLLKAPAWDAAA